MKEVYTAADLARWKEVTAGEPHPLRFAVIGDPVAHSASPQMHNAAVRACGIDAAYGRIHVRPEELPAALANFAEAGFLGVNCTIPHKPAVLAAVDDLHPRAQRAGGVNTLLISPEKKLHGWSTDGPGFERALLENLPEGVRGQRVAILGAGGGAGRAVAMQCAESGAQEVMLINRQKEKLVTVQTAIAEAFPATAVQAISWTEANLAKALESCSLVVNCSALGMRADDPSPVPAELLQPAHFVFDTIYAGGETPLMRAAAKAGARSMNGLAMLLHQGALAFEIWWQRPAPLEVMRAALHATKPV